MDEPLNHSPLAALQASQDLPLGPRPEACKCGAALHFGDPEAELRAARHGAALWDASDRGLVRVDGPDAAAFLHRIVAAGQKGPEVGTILRSLLLSSKGRVLADFDLEALEGGFRLGTGPGGAPALLANLDAYHFGEDLTLVDATETSAPLDLSGPEAAATLERALGTPPERGWVQSYAPAWHADPVTVAAIGGPAGPGYRIEAGPEGLLAAFEALVEAGAVPAGLETREIVRIEAGRSLFGRELDDDVTPQEAGLEPGDGFQLDKGCYVGQEVVAKIDTYGGQNRRVEGLAFEGDAPVEAGTPVLTEDDEEAGIITSWTRSPTLGGGLALARMKERLRTKSGTYRVADRAARAVELPVAVS